MVDLKRAIFSQDFKYKNVDGTESIITIYPLKGNYIPIVFDIADKIRLIPVTENEADALASFFNAVDSKTIAAVHEVCMASIKRSLPSEDDETINDFVNQHMFELIPIVLSLNLGAKSK